MTSGQKQIETKTRRKGGIRTSGDPGYYIAKSFAIKRKVQEETWSETGSEAPSPRGGAAKGGPAPRRGEVPSGTVSYSFSSRNFPYLIKMTKITLGK